MSFDIMFQFELIQRKAARFFYEKNLFDWLSQPPSFLWSVLTASLKNFQTTSIPLRNGCQRQRHQYLCFLKIIKFCKLYLLFWFCVTFRDSILSVINSSFIQQLIRFFVRCVIDKCPAILVEHCWDLNWRCCRLYTEVDYIQL